MKFPRPGFLTRWHARRLLAKDARRPRYLDHLPLTTGFADLVEHRRPDPGISEEFRNRMRANEARERLDAARTKHVFASRVIIDNERHQVYVDGVRLPWWLREEPTVEPYGDNMPVSLVNFTLLCDGQITIQGDNGSRRTIDPVLGDVGLWAREYVRTEMLKAFPWLKA